MALEEGEVGFRRGSWSPAARYLLGLGERSPLGVRSRLMGPQGPGAWARAMESRAKLPKDAAERVSATLRFGDEAQYYFGVFTRSRPEVSWAFFLRTWPEFGLIL